MMDESNDPRVYFAAERTLLAWVRTGIAMIGLGFVVARFGLFLQIVRQEAHPSSHPGSTYIGVGLVLLGSAAVALAAWQHTRFCKALPPSERPREPLPNWSVWFSLTLSVVGLVLAGYILLRSQVN
ncbi:MAG: YidH family protein [Pirellulales bacterium]